MSSDQGYSSLKQLVKEAGLLERRPLRYYGMRTVALAAVLVASCAVMAIAEATWQHLLNAAFLGFVFVHLSFLGHDLGHWQVFRRGIHNEVAGLVVSALVGINRSWWVQKHNRHHANPNHVELDPDVQNPVVAFTDENAAAKPWWIRPVVRHQAALFYPLVCLEGIVLKVSGILHLTSAARLRFPVPERAAMALHLAAYLSAIFILLEPLQAALFIIVNQAVMGLYLGSMFAPNHKGMVMPDASSQLDILRRQVVTSRNVRPGAISDFLYGGLNYQIEHHLFPAMPRNRLRDARDIVRPFCEERGIQYHETSAFQSQREILQHLQSVGASLDAPRAEGSHSVEGSGNRWVALGVSCPLPLGRLREQITDALGKPWRVSFNGGFSRTAYAGLSAGAILLAISIAIP